VQNVELKPHVKLVGTKPSCFWISGKNFHDSKAVYASYLAKES